MQQRRKQHDHMNGEGKQDKRPPHSLPHQKGKKTTTHKNPLLPYLKELNTYSPNKMPAFSNSKFRGHSVKTMQFMPSELLRENLNIYLCLSLSSLSVSPPPFFLFSFLHFLSVLNGCRRVRGRRTRLNTNMDLQQDPKERKNQQSIFKLSLTSSSLPLPLPLSQEKN